MRIRFLLLPLTILIAGFVGDDDPVRVGIIGLDTSHSVRFAELINTSDGDSLLARYRVTAAYPYGSRTIPSSYERIPRYIEEVRGYGVDVVESIDALLERVDVVLLETNDGHLHLEQALEVIRAGKPMFVDKPAAASLDDVAAIYLAAERAGVPIFSASSLRWAKNAREIRAGSIGEVTGATTYGPAPLEPSHVDLYWYGIHAVELLYTVMGTGCERVTRAHSEDVDAVTCRWDDGRIGTAYGLRKGPYAYGGTAFGEDGISEIGPYGGYEPLARAILEFFDTGHSPVDAAETLEIYAFMSAADESKERGGAPVSVPDLLEAAEKAAEKKLASLE